jgi:hypothetical protein
VYDVAAALNNIHRTNVPFLGELCELCLKVFFRKAREVSKQLS